MFWTLRSKSRQLTKSNKTGQNRRQLVSISIVPSLLTEIVGCMPFVFLSCIFARQEESEKTQ
jgi:hypothetical protein